MTDYAKFAKIERAKVLLKSTDQSIQDIAAALSFSTRNYFSRVFQEVTGQTPHGIPRKILTQRHKPPALYP